MASAAPAADSLPGAYDAAFEVLGAGQTGNIAVSVWWWDTGTIMLTAEAVPGERG